MEFHLLSEITARDEVLLKNEGQQRFGTSDLLTSMPQPVVLVTMAVIGIGSSSSRGNQRRTRPLRVLERFFTVVTMGFVISGSICRFSVSSFVLKGPIRTLSFKSTTRLFGSNDYEQADIYIENDQTTIKDLDIDRLRLTIGNIREILGYPSYGVSLLLVEDKEMKQTNLETRGINKPTDILSFPFHPAIYPGKLVEPEFDIPDYYNLGDMMVDVPYVVRRCQEDKTDNQRSQVSEDDNQDERGVSTAMSTVYDPEIRIHMLLIHGMLHLLGHDHENDEDYELMVNEEDRLLDLLDMRPGKKSR